RGNTEHCLNLRTRQRPKTYPPSMDTVWGVSSSSHPAMHRLAGSIPGKGRVVEDLCHKEQENGHMARLAGVDIPREKRVVIALTYIYGVGYSSAVQILY